MSISLSLFGWGCLLLNAAWLLLWLLHMKGGLINLGNRPLGGLLNSSVAMLGSPGLIGVDLIWKQDI